LRLFLRARETPDALKAEPLKKLAELLPVLTTNRKLAGDPDAVEAVAAVLAQRLADDVTGPDLARQLAMAQGYAMTRSARDWFIVEYPSEYWFFRESSAVLIADLSGILADLKTLLPRLVEGLALGAGRAEDGLQTLIEAYLKANGLGSDRRKETDVENSWRKLLNALVNFAEKVTIIANFDPLVRETEPAYKQKDTNRYIRVLQAVGNSIISQVDALRQLEAHRNNLTNARDTEVAGIRNAEARAAAVLKEISAELAAKNSFPDQEVIQKLLKAGLKEIDKIVAQLGITLKQESEKLATARATVAKWLTTENVLLRKELQDSVDEYGKIPAARTTAEVTGEITRALRIWEGKAGLPGGAGDEEAGRLEEAAGALGELTFSGDSSGAVKEKYLAIVSEVRRKLVAARAVKNENDVKKWETARDVLAGQTVQDTVEQYGKTTASRTAANVVGEIVRLLSERRDQARFPGGAGDEEAARLERTTKALGELTFPGDSAGQVKEKYRRIVGEVGSKLADAREQESKIAAPVEDLQRWHASVRRLTEGGSPALAIPGRIHEGKPMDDGQKPTAKDVLDVMVATLRYEHVNAMREHGPDNPITKNLAAAVELNYAYRSGMVHIRPASVFLRNSYPASMLQQDPTSGFWRNMLTDHAMHQIPFYDWFQGQEEEATIKRAIDKQFWQSVNQVRVSGTGLTNYVIAKDDVGNWYVKSYSSNPEPIIKSAKNLAMFSAGSAMGANFLAKGAQPGASGGAIPQEIRSTLGRQYDRVSERYEKATRDVRTELAKEIGTLNSKVRGVLAGGKLTDADLKQMFPDPDPQDVAAETKVAKPAAKDAKPNPELAELKKTLEEDKQDKQKEKALKEEKQKGDTLKPISTLNAEIANGLRAIKRYRSQVQSKLNAMIAPEEKPAATNAAAPTQAASAPAASTSTAANPAAPSPGATTPAPPTPGPPTSDAPTPASPAPTPPNPGETKPADPKKLTAKEGEEAKKAVDKVFKDLLEKFINERKTANGEYESALMLINEFTGL
jgi:hypothetical protein